MDKVRIPIAVHRWKLEKEGFATVLSGGSIPLQMHEEGKLPPDMVYVPEGMVSPYLVSARLERLSLSAFFMDRHEVTNGEFKAFVDGGGYQNPELWTQDFVRDGQNVSWQDAMAWFRDKTGRPGPSTWELGTFPEGRERFPVGGVSWYEAVAYAEFAGKALPTLYHWLRVSNPDLASFIVPFSNFNGKGPARVGSYEGISPYGCYDVAGNLGEWCWNAVENENYIMGGSFQNPGYMFSLPHTRSAWDRSETNGFRCMKAASPEGFSAETLRSIPLETRNYDEETPASDEAFEIYRRFYSYDKTDLAVKVESREDSEYWTKEKIAYDAAYGNERMAAYLFLPKNSKPPYQTVVYFPGADAFSQRSSEKLVGTKNLFLVRSGRALLYPIYKSTYERGDSLDPQKRRPSATDWRDHVLFWVKDVSRSIDYLETRSDIDIEKLAFFGQSWGGDLGPIILALEKRLKAGILTGSGFLPIEIIRDVPEADQINFAPRVTVPVLMLNGRYDTQKPVMSAQIPMFRLLGTPNEHKRHILYETGHFNPMNEQIRDSLNWLDRYLGPVQ
jgi:formylglycine-generating enzyme required for sulfatase activity/cephalosporin-C deacetylase-like acetyl esterase